MRAERGYGAVLAERPVRRLLVASLGGRLAFSMLPLGLVLFATAETGSTATAGLLMAAFAVTSALAPARGRIVDREGPRALIGFALTCAAGIVALAVAGAAGVPRAALVALGGLAGAAVPPLGPFTRAVWGVVLRDRGERLQRVYALDSAGEEGALIVAPLVVAIIVAVASPGAALVVAAAGLLAGTVGSGRSELTGRLEPATQAERPRRARLPAALWLVIASLLGPGAALGAINVAVPALMRAAGTPATAGVLLSALAVGTASASLLAGRRNWRWPPLQRLAAAELALAGAFAAAAALAERTALLALVLIVAGMALGALFVTLYVLVDELTPAGAATRTFAWLVTANNGGMGLGAAVAGALIAASDEGAGLWLAAACSLGGVVAALAAGAAGRRADHPQPSPGTGG